MREEIKSILDGISPSEIEDDGAREIIIQLISLVETLAQENQRLREENKKLRDQIKKRKGGNPRPDVSKDENNKSDSETPEEGMPEESSDKWEKGEKNGNIKVDREEVLEVDGGKLPEDAEFKGYEEILVQEIRLETDNVRYRREKYWSPSKGETIIADLPEGVEGAFGPKLRSFMITLSYGCNVPREKIKKLLAFIGICISDGSVSNIVSEVGDSLHDERDQIQQAAKEATRNQVFDHTGMKVDGENYHCGIRSTRKSTVYRVTENKSRLATIKALGNVDEPMFQLDENTISHLKNTRISAAAIREVEKLPWGRRYGEDEFDALITSRLPAFGPRQKKWLKEGALLSGLKEIGEYGISRIICDDAPQYMYVAEERGLCWIHESRHYRELTPLSEPLRDVLAGFVADFWAYYEKLLDFKDNPSPKRAGELEEAFDSLFGIETGYGLLDDCIENTRNRKEGLLQVLEDPSIPLHNNLAERGARGWVVKRKISMQTRSEKGTRSWETCMSLLETAKKLGVSFFDYIYDRLSGTNDFPSLAEQIEEHLDYSPPEYSYQIST